MSDADFDKITPAELDLNPGKPPRPPESPAVTSPLANEEARQWEAYRRRNTRILWGALGVLVMLAAAVMLVLPRYVAPGAGTPPVAALPAPPPAAGPAISPYQEAQLMQQRTAAQEALAELLELQDALEIRAVESWAGADFARAIDQARAGDEAYRQQRFLEAGDAYREGVATLREIDARRADVLASLLKDGATAIENGEPEAALEAYQLANLMDPENRDADRGLARAQVLEQVLALLAEGDGLRQAGDLEAARERYREALAVDAAHRGAARALEQIEAAIVDRDFAARMSRGYGLLQADQPEDAAAAFRQALALRPGSPEAEAGIEQAEDRRTSVIINRHLAAGQEHADAERWTQALEEFNKALAVDPNVVPAMEGRDRAQSRLNLDQFLAATIDNPLRLADDAVLAQTREVHANALRIPAPGPRLSQQLRQVEDLIARAREPVNVTLRSDGVTRVTLFRVGELGQFSSHNLELTPGTYVAVGIREGYRDVRQEFTVAFDGEPPVVTVACNERI